MDSLYQAGTDLYFIAPNTFDGSVNEIKFVLLNGQWNKEQWHILGYRFKKILDSIENKLAVVVLTGYPPPEDK